MNKKQLKILLLKILPIIILLILIISGLLTIIGIKIWSWTL